MSSSSLAPHIFVLTDVEKSAIEIRRDEEERAELTKQEMS